jgi:hypothetical protein
MEFGRGHCTSIVNCRWTCMRMAIDHSSRAFEWWARWITTASPRRVYPPERSSTTLDCPVRRRRRRCRCAIGCSSILVMWVLLSPPTSDSQRGCSSTVRSDDQLSSASSASSSRRVLTKAARLESGWIQEMIAEFFFTTTMPSYMRKAVHPFIPPL